MNNVGRPHNHNSAYLYYLSTNGIDDLDRDNPDMLCILTRYRIISVYFIK